MAIYEYKCEKCALQFEVMKPMSKASTSESCPECGDLTQKIPSVCNHTFAHQPTGPVPQNTGVYQIDHNVDRVIGRDAESRWEKISERTKYKESKIKDARQDGVDAKMEHLVRTRDGAGDYRMISEPERQAVNERRELSVAVAQAVAKQT